ncbi:MAG: 6-bladed beta-propeller [Mediterranea sp.]|jgi:hypothetical protein|nr:6-bladed beta-propeller [Mediterranea sp.]
MNKLTFISAFTLIILISGCESKKESSPLPVITISENLPEKELTLQDFMDVEYIPLETTDEFITQGVIRAIGDKYIVAGNYRNDGNIFIFDRKGKAIRKINRLGQGDQEYTYGMYIVLDEANEELFVNDVQAKKILVYDLLGHFKRSLHYPADTDLFYVLDYDKDNLIGYDTSWSMQDQKQRGDRSFHLIISKKDGSISRKIYIPYDIIKTTSVTAGQGTATTMLPTITPDKNNRILVDASTDTVYKYVAKEDRLEPFLVKAVRKDPEAWLTIGTITDNYYFLRATEKSFDFEKISGFPYTDIVYSKQERATYKVTIANSDYAKARSVSMTENPVNGKIATYQLLNVDRLIEAYENDELQGALKEITSRLNEDDNPVIMVMTQKGTVTDN